MQLMQDGSSGQFSERAVVALESGLCLSGCMDNYNSCSHAKASKIIHIHREKEILSTECTEQQKSTNFHFDLSFRC